MKFAAAFLLIIYIIAPFAGAQSSTQRITLTDLRDHIRGGWAGKIVGVAFGGPTEFRSLDKLVPLNKLPKWKPEMVRDALDQDDLYVQLSYSEAFDAKGLSVTTEDFAEMLKQSQYQLWHTNQAARRALRRGVPVMDVATPEHSVHGEDISFQIIADFVGLSFPAMPKSAMELSDRVARVSAWGDGQCAGRFVSGMYTAAFFESDPEKIINAGLASIPVASNYAKAIRDVVQWHRENPDDWKKTWKLLNDKWGDQDRCPYGALLSLDIDAKLNGGFVAIGLLYGGDDFEKTMTIATRCGQDSDCNPCTACGIWGAAHGFAKIPPQYTQDIEPMCDKKFVGTNSTFHSAVEKAVSRAVAMTQANGGRVEDGVLIIVPQKVEPTPVRTFPDFGKPIERIASTDPRWQWTGNWKQQSTWDGEEKFASDKDASATISFKGTGALICGPYIGEGGTADVYLDGKLDRTIDVWPDMDVRSAMEDVWHKFGLSDSEHTVKIVVRGERYGESKGTTIRIHSLIVYRALANPKSS